MVPNSSVQNGDGDKLCFREQCPPAASCAVSSRCRSEVCSVCGESLSLSTDTQVCLASVGAIAWVVYTAVGAAALPIHTVRGQRHVNQLQATQEERQRLLGDRYASIRSKGQRWGAAALSRREQRDAATVERERQLLERDRFQLQVPPTTRIFVFAVRRRQMFFGFC